MNTITLKFIKTKPEAGNVKTFVFETGGLKWIAGQYQAYILPHAGPTQAENEHWFTIAAAPSEKEIHISTRISESPFKKALNAMKPGDTIQAHSLGGDFTWEESGDAVVFVAGGIGSTPFRSILIDRDRTMKPLNVTFLYFNRNDEIPFLDEFTSLATKHPEFTLIPIVGEKITADLILGRLDGRAHQTVYLSGPEPMVESVGAELKAKGVNLKQDWFPGYTDQNF
ncbi:MAG: FAD-dependent oxidoreductase [Patescibacteria group bacterium]|nr:FAD-dependent oxidoreductase [Patescibacteria group bacterium]MDE2172835.1 FAD-dependent oxidoreductase [Patescibacteria group bacterium]